jgi:hypothetical protein
MPASHGIELDRSMLGFWVGYAAAELMPLYERSRRPRRQPCPFF